MSRVRLDPPCRLGVPILRSFLLPLDSIACLQLAGPMWSAPIQNPEFIGKVLEHVEESPDNYGTVARMKGMLTVAKEELDKSFYFTPSKIAGTFHCECPPLGDVAYATLLSFYRVHIYDQLDFLLAPDYSILASKSRVRMLALALSRRQQRGRMFTISSGTGSRFIP